MNEENPSITAQVINERYVAHLEKENRHLRERIVELQQERSDWTEQIAMSVKWIAEMEASKPHGWSRNDTY